MGIHVAIQNKALLKATYQEVSDPKSPSYLNFLTGQRLKDLAGPSPQQSYDNFNFTHSRFSEDACAISENMLDD